MRAGRLRHSIAIERKTETVSETGAATSTWTNLATVRAEIETQTTAEFLTGFGEAQTGTVVFRTRHPGIEITTADWVTYAGARYNLKKIVAIENGRALELWAVATS